MKIWLIMSFVLVASSVVIAQPVRICGDSAEWPPYNYYSRVKGKPEKSKVIGIVPELLDEAFRLMGMTYTITLIPWKRCLMEVYNFGKKQRYVMVIWNQHFNSIPVSPV